MCVEPAFAISVDIKLNLTDTAIELLRKRLMLVVKTFVGVCILRLPDLAFVGRNSGVITVVRANDLNLIQFQCSVSGLCPGPRRIAGQNCGQGSGERDAEAAQVQVKIL
jgi:hypothetical protein